jgi:hypothetical protein
MPNLGLSELLVVALVALPAMALAAVPVVFAVILWRRQTDLGRRLERIEEFLQHRDRAP